MICYDKDVVGDKVKKNQEYLKNFSKKYYLFGSFNISGEKKDIPLYHGSLRSILKYTTYKDLKQKTDIKNMEIFKKILEHNLFEHKRFLLNFNFSKVDFYMSSDKLGKNKCELKFSDSRDLLFCNSDDIYRFIKRNVSKEILLDISFGEFLLSLIDENYKEKLNNNRDDHNNSTPLDMIRIIIGRSLANGFMKRASFEDMIINEHDAFLTIIEYICKDINKKEVLINKVLSITEKKQILSDEEMSERSYYLTCKLKKDNESRKYIENEIYNSLYKVGLVTDIKEVVKEKKVEKENSVAYSNYNEDLARYLASHEELTQKSAMPSEIEDYVDDDFLGPKEANDPRYREIN